MTIVTCDILYDIGYATDFSFIIDLSIVLFLIICTRFYECGSRKNRSRAKRDGLQKCIDTYGIIITVLLVGYIVARLFVRRYQILQIYDKLFDCLSIGFLLLQIVSALRIRNLRAWRMGKD